MTSVAPQNPSGGVNDVGACCVSSSCHCPLLLHIGDPDAVTRVQAGHVAGPVSVIEPFLLFFVIYIYI